MPPVSADVLCTAIQLRGAEPMPIRDLAADPASASTVLGCALCLIADHAPDLLCIEDVHGELVFVSRNSQELIGWAPELLLGRCLEELVHPDDIEAARACRAIHPPVAESRVRYRLRCGSNRYRWVECHSRCSDDRKHIISILRDVDQEVALLGKLERDARLDALTGLLNRRALQTSLAAELKRTRRKSRTTALVLFDCDHFKRINDAYGHGRGDEVLRQMGSCVAQVKRTYDIAGRWGGDEFVLLLPETDADGALLVANRIRRAVQSALPELTLSFGISSTANASSVDQLLEQADAALYEAKRLGRNRCVQWRPELAAEPYVYPRCSEHSSKT
jgi:diguanylate cyclase (GGDEF)-like protein/PAS domain S-box-containing protein